MGLLYEKGIEMEKDSSQDQIIFYGTRWCLDCKRSMKILNRYEIEYHYVDIDKDPDGKAFVQKVNNGNRSVPTIVFPDGEILVEPSREVLKRKLGAKDSD